MARRRRLPGYRWRLLAWGDDGRRITTDYDGTEGVCFDELVVDGWLHVEQMSTRSWFIGVGDWHINVRVPPKGDPEVMLMWDGPGPDPRGEGTAL